MIIIVILQAIMVVMLIGYNIFMNKKLTVIAKSKDKLEKILSVREVLEIVSEPDTVDEKLNKLNNMLIKNLGVDYSTINIFNGINYEIK